MKKIIISLLLLIVLTGCSYIEEEDAKCREKYFIAMERQKTLIQKCEDRGGIPIVEYTVWGCYKGPYIMRCD